MMLLRPSGLLALLLLSPAAAAGTLFVNANLNTGLNDGSSWANAFQGQDGLQAALAIAVSGDDVYAAQGTFHPTNTGTRTISFNTINGVGIYGGFVGTESSPSQRPPFGTAESILNGDLAGNDGTNQFAENSNHVIRGTGSNATAIIDGFTVTNGNANTSGGNNDRGGGILCSGAASPTVRNCRFVTNRCTFGGGAGYINSGAIPTFTDCQFVDNVGGSFGGAFDIAGGGTQILFERCSFSGNRAARAGALEIFSTNGTKISNCEFTGNTATGGSGGGAIWLGSGGTTTIVNTSIVENHANTQAMGGVRIQSASAVVSNSILWNNTGTGTAHQVDLTANVTYSIVEGGFAGVGNISGNPFFVNQAGGDFALTSSSPAIDAGNNSTVLAGVTLDLAHNARFFDDPSVADTGAGTAPIVDMGAYESSIPGPVTIYCTGDGSGTICPCFNIGGAGNGCANGTSPAGAHLTATGVPSVSNDTLTMLATNSTPLNSGIFFQSNNPAAGGNGVVFGDGLMCVSGSIFRIQVVFSSISGTATSTLPIAATTGTLAGQTKRMQWWYRDVVGPCGSGFNTSNGVEVVWLP